MAAVSQLFQQAMQLSPEMRVDLAEHLIESAAPPPEVVEDQMKTVRTRMENVERGLSRLVVAEDAHRFVREALAATSKS